MTFAPMLDIARDPRWGRIAEGAGEDPWVVTQFAIAKVRGFQGDGLPEGLASAGAVAPRLSISAPMARPLPDVTMPQRMFPNVFCMKSICHPSRRPWRCCAAIMPAFNDIAGIPMTAHIPLLRDWLRREAGFDGVIVSDYNAVAELIRHGMLRSR